MGYGLSVVVHTLECPPHFVAELAEHFAALLLVEPEPSGGHLHLGYEGKNCIDIECVEDCDVGYFCPHKVVQSLFAREQIVFAQSLSDFILLLERQFHDFLLFVHKHHHILVCCP